MADQTSFNTNKVGSYIPQCQVIWFQWKTSDEELSNTSLTEVNPDTVSDSTAFDISDHLQYFSFSKHLGDPAGSFSLRLDSTKDWKDFIKPGQWMLVLMSQNGDLFPDEKSENAQTGSSEDDISGNIQVFKLAPSVNDIQKNNKKIRAICRVDRVATNISTGSNGEFIASYVVTGRDYGCIYQDTEIWYNLFLNETITIPSLSAYIKSQSTNNIQASITVLLGVIHDLVLSLHGNKELQAAITKLKSELSLPTQWIMPKKLLQYLNQLPPTGSPYYGDIENIKNFHFTPFSMPVINPLTYIPGRLWEKLKHYSAEALHELFTETTDTGQMQLNFRLIPWGMDSSGYPNLAQSVTPFSTLVTDPATSVNLTALELLTLDLGEDEHSRVNHFLTIATPYFTQASSAIAQLIKPSIKGRKFPLGNNPSIARNGLKKSHLELETFFIGFTNPAFASSDLSNCPIAITYLLEANELAFDYWNNFIFFESGSLTILGRNDVKIGKALALDSSFPYNPGAFYYIEGYEDEFTVDEKGASVWTQHIFVTHGIEPQDLTQSGNTSIQFSKRNRIFNKESSFIKKST